MEITRLLDFVIDCIGINFWWEEVALNQFILIASIIY